MVIYCICFMGPAVHVYIALPRFSLNYGKIKWFAYPTVLSVYCNPVINGHKRLVIQYSSTTETTVQYSTVSLKSHYLSSILTVPYLCVRCQEEII